MGRPLPMLSGLRGPDATATRQALFALQKQLPLLKSSSDLFPRPEPGRQLVEEDTGRIFVGTNVDWVYVAPDAVMYVEEPGTANGVHNQSLGFGATWTPDYRGTATIYANFNIDVDAAGRAGFLSVQRNVTGVGVSTVQAGRFHDSTEGGNCFVSVVATDVFEPGLPIRYQLLALVDGGLGNVTFRDGTFRIEWHGRV